MNSILHTPCLDCGVELSDHGVDEWYMVRDIVWAQAFGNRVPYRECRKADWLCIGCLEDRLERQLTRRDFQDVPLSFMVFASDRLNDRLRAGANRLQLVTIERDFWRTGR